MSVRDDTPLDSFEANLLTELRGVVAERGHAPERVPTRTGARRPLLLAVAAASALGLVAWVGAMQADPAYAVEEGDDGSITFQLFDPGAADDLAAALSARGVPADVAVTPIGHMCAPGRFTDTGVDPHEAITFGDDGPSSITIPAGMLEAGQTLVVEFRGQISEVRTGGDTIGVGFWIAEGPVGDCVVVPDH